jgi:hypothetical protein
MPSEFKHVGTVEILATRIYNLDPYAVSGYPATEVIVHEGVYPLLSDGYSHVWVMGGELNGHFLRRGDGLFITAQDANAIPTNIGVQFPSKLYGPDDWKELVEHETAREGHPEQRIRITILEDS